MVLSLLLASLLTDQQVVAPIDIALQTELEEAIKWRRLDDTVTLLDQGADPTHIRSSWSASPIGILMADNNLSSEDRKFSMACLRLFLESGMPTIVHHNQGSVTNLINHAAFNYRADLIQLLLKHDAKLTDPEERNESALGSLLSSTKLVILDRHGFKEKILLDDRDYNEYEKVKPRVLKSLKLLLEAGADPNLKSPDGVPLISYPIYHGRIDEVKMLLKYKVDLSARRPVEQGSYTLLSDYTPLHTACLRPGPHQAEIVKLLLAHGADKSAKDSLGRTALEIAVQKGLKKAAAVLRR